MNSEESVAASDLYSREYYLSDCEGFAEFRRTGGRKLSRRLKKCLELLAPRPGETVLDVGCGRGELALHSTAAGAQAWAVDPSRDALRLVAEASASWTGDCRPRCVRALGEHLPFASASVHAVVLADVVEHFDPPGMASLLRECTRVLRPQGRLVVHTQPNRRLVSFTVPLLSRFSRLWGTSLPRDLRTEMSRGSGPDYHPGEQTQRSLERALRGAGLSIDQLWLEGSYPVHRIFGEGRLKRLVLARFRKSRLLKELLASQIFALARRP